MRKPNVMKAVAATALTSTLLALAGCAYEPPPQPRLPYRGNEATNPAYNDPRCGPPPYAAGSACSPYAAPPPAQAPSTDAYGRPYPPTDAYGRPVPTDAQGRPIPQPVPPAYQPQPQYQYDNRYDNSPTPGSETAH